MPTEHICNLGVFCNLNLARHDSCGYSVFQIKEYVLYNYLLYDRAILSFRDDFYIGCVTNQ